MKKWLQKHPWQATIALIIVCTTPLTVVACSDAVGDTEITDVNQAGAKLFQMPDGFSNFAGKCDGPNMVYTLYHGGSAYGGIAVAPNDPRCVDQ